MGQSEAAGKRGKPFNYKNVSVGSSSKNKVGRRMQFFTELSFMEFISMVKCHEVD